MYHAIVRTTEAVHSNLSLDFELLLAGNNMSVDSSSSGFTSYARCYLSETNWQTAEHRDCLFHHSLIQVAQMLSFDWNKAKNEES